VQVSTSSKDDLLLLLLDGGVRFAEAGLSEMEKGDREDRTVRSDALLRAQRIVLELMTALSPIIGLEIYENLQGMYRFTFSRLFEGNARSSPELVKEAVTIFRQIRDMWRETVEKARSEKEVGTERPRPNSSISLTA
jgi:flagellar protein FliS